MALAKATPARLDGEAAQRQLGEADNFEMNVADPTALDIQSPSSTRA
jgi:hypothetical protein